MITKTLLARCGWHLRVQSAGRGFQRSTLFSRSQCCSNRRTSTEAARCFSQAHAADDEEQQIRTCGYCSAIAPHIRSCRSQSDEEETELSMRDTGFIVSILGSGGGMPSKLRITSATILRLGGISFLFDAGEGLQRQFALSKLGITKIRKIFITHLHGDHLFGLPGLLLQMRTAGVSSLKGAPAVHVYGPPGLHTYISANLTLSCSAFAGFTVVVHELVGGQSEGGPQGGCWGKKQELKNVFLGSYPEMANRWLVKRRIEQNDDGTWTIEKPQELSVPEAGGELLERNDVIARSSRRLFISAAEVTHLPGVQTFGFVVQEVEPPRKIDPEKATKLGVRPGPKYQLLKIGFPVLSDDDSREIQPESVLLHATTKARKFALIGDNSRVSCAMANLCQNADVLVHEATLSRENATEATIRGHSSAEMAGAFAKSVKAKTLVLNHLSPGISNMEEQIPELIEKVQSTNEGVSRVVVSQDFMELIVPRLGFDEASSSHEAEIDNIAATAP